MSGIEDTLAMFFLKLNVMNEFEKSILFLNSDSRTEKILDKVVKYSVSSLHAHGYINNKNHCINKAKESFFYIEGQVNYFLSRIQRESDASFFSMFVITSKSFTSKIRWKKI